MIFGPLAFMTDDVRLQLEKDISNSVAGFGDLLSGGFEGHGLTGDIRELLGGVPVDYCSAAYAGGRAAGWARVAGLLTLGLGDVLAPAAAVTTEGGVDVAAISARTAVASKGRQFLHRSWMASFY